MNKLALIPVAIALTLFVSCGKQQTEAEKNAEVERQVQQRLEAEHQAEHAAAGRARSRFGDAGKRTGRPADRCRSRDSDASKSSSSSEPVPEEELESSRDVPTDESASYDAFYAKLDPTGTGAKPRITVMSSNHAQRKVLVSGAPTRTGAGFIRMQAGRGYLRNRSVGRPITTVAGHVCVTLAGCGCQVMNGRQRGFPGARVMTTWVGRRSRRRRTSIVAPVFIIGPIAITISDRKNIRLFRQTNSVRCASSKPLFHRSGTSRSSTRRSTSPISPTAIR